tara:strand:- start:738 stop:1478 length:741 start_codon:yes stop_codon:yes gene_type:complete
MSLLANLASDATIENESDSVGGNGPWASGAFLSTVTMAYVEKSKGGATSLVVHLKNSDGRELKSVNWVASGNAKGNKNYYEREGEKRYLPGFNVANSLCLLTVGKELSAMNDEEKLVAIYDYDAKAEVPRKVPVLTELIGQEIIAGVIHQVVDKNVKNDAGEYIPSGETRAENEVDKFFRAKDKMTTAEIRAEATEPDFHDKWVTKWEGQVKDRSTKGATNVASGAFGGAQKPAGAAKPQTSLFNA